MSEKRRDSKGRILQRGEGQRSNGEYYYQYTDNNGKRCVVYSWRLTKTDPFIQGKHRTISLREKEAEINKKLEDGITLSEPMTVIELAHMVEDNKTGTKVTTQINTNYFLRRLETYPISKMRVVDVKRNHVEDWLRKANKDGLRVGTLKHFRARMKEYFDYAINILNIVVFNPANFKINTVIRERTPPRVPLSEDTIEKMYEFMDNNYCASKYRDIITVLLHTGLRASEFAGITEDKIDFKHHKLKIDCQLVGVKGGLIETPKSSAGFRIIYMDAETEESLRNIIQRANEIKKKTKVKTDYIVLSHNGKPRTGNGVYTSIKQFERLYNDNHDDPITIHPHLLRHTYATTQSSKGMNSLALMYLMGHSSLATTNLYTHTSERFAEAEVQRLYYPEQ